MIMLRNKEVEEKETRMKENGSNFTPEKLESYFGFVLLCSLVHKPRMTSYWSKKKQKETPGKRDF